MSTTDEYKQLKLLEIKIELTDACGLRCVHCSSNASTHGRLEISPDKCIEILDDSAELGVKEVTFSGGEPLLYEHLADVVERARGHGMDVSIYTTGNVAGYEELVQRLKKLDVTKIIFSMFSSKQDGHEAVTNTPGSFARTRAAVTYAVDLDFTVELHFVPLASNYHELEALVSLGAELGATRTSILRFVPQGRGEDMPGQVLTLAQNLELRTSVIRLYKRNSECIRCGSPYNIFMLKKMPQCRTAKDRLTILPNLQIVPCDAFKRIPPESIVKNDAFSSLASARLPDCWMKSKYLNVIRDYLASDFSPECQSCDNRSMCNSGCLAQKFLANHNNLRKSRDPHCLRGLAEPEVLWEAPPEVELSRR